MSQMELETAKAICREMIVAFLSPGPVDLQIDRVAAANAIGRVLAATIPPIPDPEPESDLPEGPYNFAEYLAKGVDSGPRAC